MTLTRQVARNTSFHFIGKAIALLFNLLAFALIARYLGRFGFGEFTTIVAFLQFFAILTDFGLYVFFIQKCGLPGVNQEKILGSFLGLKLVLSIGILSMAPLIAFFIPQYSLAIKLGVILAAGSFVCGSLIQLLTGFFQVKMQMNKVMISEIIGKAILVLLVILSIYTKLNIWAFLVAMTLAGLTSFIILYRFAFKIMPIKWIFNWQEWKQIIKQSWPIGLSVVLTTIYFKGDTIILSLFRSQEEVGIYGVAYRILEALIMAPPIFMGLILPYLSRAWAEKKLKDFEKIFQKSFDFFAIIVWPLLIGTWLLASSLVTLLAGKDFGISAQPLRILMVAVCFIFLGTLTTYSVIAIEKYREMLKYYLIAAVFAAIGYLILIPRFSYFGAAWVTVLVECMVTLMAGWIVVQETKIKISWKVFQKSFYAAIIMGIALYLFNRLPLLILIVLGATTYFGFLYLFKGICKQTIQEILVFRKGNK